MPSSDDRRRFAAPAAFLLAVTIAVILVRSGLEHGSTPTRTATTAAVTTTTTAAGSTTTVARTRPAAKGRAFWTVKAGDTFGVISAKTGVPVRTIAKLNPKASSMSLFIGEKIRIR